MKKYANLSSTELAKIVNNTHDKIDKLSVYNCAETNDIRICEKCDQMDYTNIYKRSQV